MKYLTVLIVVASVALSLRMPFPPGAAHAQVEETPVLGEPVMVTPLITPAATTPSDLGAPPAADVPRGATTAPTVRPAMANVPDRCEPNDAAAVACPLPLDAVSGPFTIVPEDDQDFFLLDVPQEASIQTVITVRATAGLDLFLTARQSETLVASGAYSLTLAPTVAGSVVLRVENRDPRPAADEQYRLEVRREIVPPSQASSAAAVAPSPDALENNWSFVTAAPIAVGVVYDLSFVCPDPRPDACPGGDHDYLQVPVKADVRYLVATFDLDLGVDTVVELFWGDSTVAAAGNDDYGPGGMLAALSWTAPGDGVLGVRIAPRNGGLAQHGAETKAAYRLAVAPIASELARKLETQIRQQANVPPPTALPTRVTAPAVGSGSPSTGAPPAAVPAGNGTPETIATGPAIIVQETVLRREPFADAPALTTLAPETPVTLRGPVRGLWVSVESAASILPGWVRFSDLQRASEVSEATTTTGAAAPSSQPSAVAAAATATISPAASTSPGGSSTLSVQVAITTLDPVLPAPGPAPASSVPYTLAVTVVASNRPPGGGGTLGFATPTPDMRQPVGRVRVQLVSVFGDVLAEGLTDAAGTVQLRRDVRPGAALHIRMPAWGVEMPVGLDQKTLIVTIPEELL